MRVEKWENSLAVRLPPWVVKALSLVEGDEMEIPVVLDRRIVVARRTDPKESMIRLRKYRGRMPIGFKFDRNDANRRV